MRLEEQAPREGAERAPPVPVATIMTSCDRSSGISMPLPLGPATVTTSPALLSHRNPEQTPAFPGSSAPVAGSVYTARRTHSDTVVPVPSSP